MAYSALRPRRGSRQGSQPTGLKLTSSICGRIPTLSVMGIAWLKILFIVSLFHLTLSSEISVADDAASPALESKLDRNPNNAAPNSNEVSDFSSRDSKHTEEVPESVRDAVNFEDLYHGGVKSYEKELWYSCAFKLERAISGHKLYSRIVSDCRLECRKNPSVSELSNLTSSVEDFDIFGSFLRASDCLRRCADEAFGIAYEPISRWAADIFKERLPYEYLQFCYHKLDQPKKAASAAYTHFLAHPDDEDSKNNVVYYRDFTNVAESDFVDLEMLPYKEHYIRATIAYNTEDWEGVVGHIEQCLEEYYLEHQRCQVDCEARYSVSGDEFITTVADWMVRITSCKSLCERELSKVYTKPIEGFVMDMYSYLQYAYSSLGKFDKAVDAAANYLAFDTSHESMEENKRILITRHGYTEEDFKPKQEVVDYVRRQSALVELMASIGESYRHKGAVIRATDTGKEEEDEEQDKDLYKEIGDLHKEMDDLDDWMSRYEQLGMHIIARSLDLNREERFVTDGLLKAEQCNELLTLAEGLKTEPQGSQIFTLKVAQEKLEADLTEELEASLRLFSRSAEVVRHYTQRYLNPDMNYHFKRSSLVCWPPSEELKTNCYPQEDGTCVKFDDLSDELYHDLYTAVTYLHTADEDADFQFLDENRGTDRAFGLKCGRTIGFNTGDRHTLSIPKSGSKRCAMVLKFTLDPNEDEREYRDLITLLHHVDELRMQSGQQEPEVLKKFTDAGVKVVKEAKELKAKERVVADGVASEAQCSTLSNMVMTRGRAGNGYNGQMSPHTLNELFSGLSMDEVIQSGAIVGDGYSHLKTKPSEVSPHTEHELFYGVNIYRASKLAYDDKISLGALRDFLDLSENSRLFTEKYFNLTKPLYFDFTHLVCRTAVDGSNRDRTDLSHPVHADNCNLQPNGSCPKEFPSFYHRDYSAILYLNEDFEGGEFFFAHSNTSEQVSVRPKCGRLVAFNAGHFHGVKAVKSGNRCALGLWFTHQSMYKELAHVQARKALKDKEEELKNRQKKTHEDL